ncbi:MAG: hypothetical protein ACLVJ8_18350, partial [Ruthenibacterium lactatiformans]
PFLLLDGVLFVPAPREKDRGRPAVRAAAPAPIWQDGPGVGLTAALFRLSGRRRAQAYGRRAVPGAVFL